MALVSLMGLAMIIEVVGGALIILGLFTRTTAAIAAVEMLFAYFMAHASNGWSPLANKGEPALLFFASFLVLLAFGARKYAVDNKLRS
jgi:putative oxidoreductase